MEISVEILKSGGYPWTNLAPRLDRYIAREELLRVLARRTFALRFQADESHDFEERLLSEFYDTVANVTFIFAINTQISRFQRD